jgi:hypothetical protein
MNPLVKLVAFAVALMAVFGGGLALGAAAGPIGSDIPTAHVGHTP